MSIGIAPGAGHSSGSTIMTVPEVELVGGVRRVGRVP